MGDHRLRDHVRRRPLARRPDGRPARAAKALPRRHRALHRQLAARRVRVVRRLADRVPGDSGPRRRIAGTRGAVDPDDDVRGRPRAQPRARDLGRGLRKRRSRRRAPRRAADELAQLVLDLLHQRPGRARARRDRPAAPAREPRRPRSPALRLRRRNDRHRRADAPRVRPDPGHRDRLEHRRDDRPARRLRRSDHLVRRDRAALEGSAPPHADLPPAHARRRERHRVPARHVGLLAVLPRHALHAAGAGLLRDRDRRRLPAADVDDRRSWPTWRRTS